MSTRSVASYFLTAPNFRWPPFDRVGRGAAGGKGAGLLRLPPTWYPPSLVVDPALQADYPNLELGDLRNVDGLAGALAKLAGESASGTLLLRSNASRESIDDRGAFVSVPIESTLDALFEGICKVWLHARDVQRDATVGFVIQPFIPPKESGHLSNEHRISRESTRWVKQTPAGTANWQVQKTEAADDRALLARNSTLADLALRAAARRLSESPSRLHLEWIWDGSRVWIVQADSAPPSVGRPPGDNFDIIRGQRVEAADLKVWTEVPEGVTREFNRWPKLRALELIDQANLGRPSFWVLTGDAITPQSLEGIRHDLSLLCSGHLLIRVDLATTSLRPNLRRSGALIDADAALSHIMTTLEDLKTGGADPSDVCFIAHRFTRARASAWAAAWPGRSSVRVDSIWGLADGLQFLPHDVTWANVDTGDVKRSVVAKPYYLDVKDEKDWLYETTPTEWLWKASATTDQLRTIAASSRRLADLRQRFTLVMWFVGILDGYDAECLAWVAMDGHETDGGNPEDFASYTRIDIETEDDLAGAEGRIDGPSILRLHPSEALIRDNSFLTKVAAMAHRFRAPVEMDGSPLSHAFYQLASEGLTVICLDNPHEPVQAFNKLVRDDIVPSIRAQGERVVSYHAGPEELLALTKRKLVEESIEVLEAVGEGATLEELADVEEVLTAIRRLLKVDRDTVTRVQSAKRERRGGFSSGAVLLETGGRRPPEADSLFSTDGLARRPDTPQVEADTAKLRVSLVPPPPAQRAPFEVTVAGVRVQGTYSSSALTLDFEKPSIDVVSRQEELPYGDE